MKKFFVFDIQWSQTDSETVIIQEACEATARARLKSWYPNAKHFNLVRVTKEFID